MKKIYIVACFALFFATGITVFAQSVGACGELSRNLKMGMTGSDVKILQQILNKNAATSIASSGAGSIGQETTYFGPKTMAAVIQFQNLYAKEVLLPVGLTSGSGFVGQYSRAKLAQLCSSTVLHTPTPTPAPPPLFSTTTGQPLGALTPPAPSPSPVVTPLTMLPIPADTASALTPAAFTSKVPVLMFLSTHTAPRGKEVSINTIGLEPAGNIIYIGSQPISNATYDAGKLTFVVPATTPRGKHELWVSGTKGETNKTFFIVTDTITPPPVIESITPQEGFLGQVVKVTGSGFLPTGNEIRISYGDLTGIASPDGKTLEFTVSPEIPDLKMGEDRPEYDISIPYWFSVVNENGMSKAVVFNLKI